MSKDFTGAVKTAAEYARQEAESASGGDPDTMVSAGVDGRSAFAKNFKEYGTKVGNGWEIGRVRLNDDYSLVLAVGTQLHSKRVRAYRAFSEKMESLGFSCSIDISTYSY